jgi:CubicO group peptidase (beta-lactamase class C family)
VPELAGTAWDKVSMKNTMNMASGLDIEENFESLMSPDSWISSFFTAAFEGKGDWRELARGAKPIEGEKPGDLFRYSGANTMVLVLAIENITGMPWQDVWGKRVWSKIGARSPFLIGLTPDGTPIAAGMNNTTPEDMLRYALLYTPSWGVVAKEKVISDKLLERIETLGDPKAYQGSTELEYGTKWFGETPERNTAQWDHAFPDGAMFKHGNMGQGIYVDPARDFCGMYFGLASNDEAIAGIDHAPGYLRAAAKALAAE